MQEVEKMGADERLTYAINKLLEAKESVANYIDGTTTITTSEEFVRLCDYLKKEYSDGKIDFSMRFDGNHFYIHPSGKDGETIDFYLNKKQN